MYEIVDWKHRLLKTDKTLKILHVRIRLQRTVRKSTSSIRVTFSMYESRLSVYELSLPYSFDDGLFR